MSEKTKGKCLLCKNELIIFHSGFCQMCYRKINERFSYYDYNPKIRIKNDKHKIICKLFVEKQLTPKEVSKKLNMNLLVIQNIRKRYLIKIDTYGKCKKEFIDELQGNNN